jgi:hypothetical protein
MIGQQTDFRTDGANYARGCGRIIKGNRQPDFFQIAVGTRRYDDPRH